MPTIDVAKDFSPRPYGRYIADGEYSAEKFREALLIPALKKVGDETLIVDLSGSRRYGSSFLDETFGGLVRSGFEKEYLKEHLVIEHNELPSIVEQCWMYIKMAK